MKWLKEEALLYSGKLFMFSHNILDRMVLACSFEGSWDEVYFLSIFHSDDEFVVCHCSECVRTYSAG